MSNPIFGPVLKGEEPKFTSRNEVLNKFSRNSRRQVRSTQQRIDHRIHLFDKSQTPGSGIIFGTQIRISGTSCNYLIH